MLIDGQPRDSIDARDRGLHYGDGLFETIAVKDARPLLWPEHMARLADGCRRLGLPLPNPDLLRREAAAEIAESGFGVLKIMLTRGCGGRGYRPPADPDITRILAFHPAPDYPPEFWTKGVRVRLCNTRLGMNPALAGMKHLNRLEQVLARREWDDDGIVEGLMRDSAGNLLEGTMSNLFLVNSQRLLTPALDQCGVAGVMRKKVLETASEVGIHCRIADVSLQELERADALFLTNALIGIWPVRQVDGQSFSLDAIPAPLRERIAPYALLPTPGHC